MRFVDGSLLIENISAADLARRFGTPVYVYEAGVIRRQIVNVQRAFARLPFRPFYAMKANGAVAILRMVKEAGFGCDCVSPGEIFLARKAGFGAEDIWFTCSNVSDEDMRAIPDERIVVNVNSMSEIDRLLTLGIRNPIALRINPDVGAGHHADVVTAGGGVKFGIELAEVAQARMIVEDAGRQVVGIHAHIGSGIDDLAPLLRAAGTLLQLSGDFPNLRFINFGGGISIPYRPGESEFPIATYGEELTTIADSRLRARGLQAILEPGRYVVAQAGTLLARITAKRISGGFEWIGCDTGFNHLVRPSKYGAYHHIVNASRDPGGVQRDVVVAGNICESGDVFTRDAGGHVVPRAIVDPHIGDLLAFRDAGAYGFSMASHYNARLLPPEVLVDEDEARVIRARQTFEHLLEGQE
ncbi:MAG TPA: diaminopimelate decarboxylase [Thermoanaerobaculia bacterium]|jgi:diaminopimelate decarboxylase|nr:diaminopimelate decarboxylase [Thermoanaerobaculia bacterium]